MTMNGNESGLTPSTALHLPSGSDWHMACSARGMSLECDHVLIGGADGLSLNSIVASSTSNPVTNGHGFLPSIGRVV